jgi:hypothetical protein
MSTIHVVRGTRRVDDVFSSSLGLLDGDSVLAHRRTRNLIWVRDQYADCAMETLHNAGIGAEAQPSYETLSNSAASHGTGRKLKHHFVN